MWPSTVLTLTCASGLRRSCRRLGNATYPSCGVALSERADRHGIVALARRAQRLRNPQTTPRGGLVRDQQTCALTHDYAVETAAFCVRAESFNKPQARNAVEAVEEVPSASTTEPSTRLKPGSSSSLGALRIECGSAQVSAVVLRAGVAPSPLIFAILLGYLVQSSNVVCMLGLQAGTMQIFVKTLTGKTVRAVQRESVGWRCRHRATCPALLLAPSSGCSSVVCCCLAGRSGQPSVLTASYLRMPSFALKQRLRCDADHSGGGVLGHHRQCEVEDPGQGGWVANLGCSLTEPLAASSTCCLKQQQMAASDCRHPAGPAAAHLCGQAAGGWPHARRLQHPEG